MGWTLEQVRDLTIEDYDELIAWAKDRAEQSKGEDGSIDVDSVIAADLAKKAKADA